MNNQIKLLFQVDEVGVVHCKVIKKPDTFADITYGTAGIMSDFSVFQTTNRCFYSPDYDQGAVLTLSMSMQNVDRIIRKMIVVSQTEGVSYSVDYGTYHIGVTFNSVKHGPSFTTAKDAVNRIYKILPSNINEPPPDYGAQDKKSSKYKFYCSRCMAGAQKENKFNKVTISTGEVVLLCNECNVTYPCDQCGYNDPKFYVKTLTEISEVDGQNKKSRVCNKCSNGYTRCMHGCGSYFDKKKYNGECPCQIGHNFKSYIKEHNADVLAYFAPDKYADEMFGIEIETGTLNKNRGKFSTIARETTELIGNNAILKYDSSIDWVNKQEQVDNDYKGFEVVTRPMVYKNALRFLKQFCKDRHPLLRSWEVGTCGLHIHVSKACLSKFEIGKILLFINNKGNRKFIKMIAKREDKRFAKFLTKKIMDYKNMHPDCHYEAVNTNKKHTIEFRIFRGTLNARTVMSYLQFVKSVIEFVRVTSLEDLNPGKYTEFLFATERSSYRELKERIRMENTKEIDERGEI